MWFVCDFVMVKDWFHEVLGLSKTEHCVLGQQNPKQNGKRGCVQISAHPCELATSTSDDHNFPVRTPICIFLDSTKISLSLQFNRMKFSDKTWAEHWSVSRTVEEWSVLGSRTSFFWNRFVSEMLGAVYRLSRELRVGCFVWYLQKLDFLD